MTHNIIHRLSGDESSLGLGVEQLHRYGRVGSAEHVHNILHFVLQKVDKSICRLKYWELSTVY